MVDTVQLCVCVLYVLHITVPGELAVRQHQALETDWELHVTTADHVLYLKLQKLCLKTDTAHGLTTGSK